MAKASLQPLPPLVKDLTDQTFGRLTVLRFVGIEKHKAVWLCRCSCKRRTRVPGIQLRAGGTRSCGCLARDHAKNQKTRLTHGLWKTREWLTWSGINRRCHDPLAANYNRYGARGIVVCKGWRESAASFVEDMGAKPSPKHSIDRKDNSLGYTCGHCDECHDRGWPANCRWATATEQAENRGPSKPVSADGVTLSVPAWAKKLGVSKQAIYSRLRHGWPPAEAVTVPFSTANTWRYRKVKRLGDG